LTIINRNFNEDLDNYLSKRKKGVQPFQKQKAFTPKEKPVVAKIQDFDDDDYYPKPKKKKKQYSFMSSIFRRRIPSEEEIEREVATLKKSERKELKAMEEDIKNVQDIEENVEETEEGLMSRFLKKLRGSRRKIEEEEDIEVKVEEPNQDLEEVKNAIRILHKWLEELPPDKLSQFKRSSDFEKYKDALKKLKMIKE
jgi:hypothetical protein